MKSIRTKITLNVLIISLLAMTIISLISYEISKRAILLESISKFSNLTILNSEKIDNWFKEQSTIIKSVSRNLSETSNLQEIQKTVEEQTRKNDEAIVFYAGFSDGSSVFGDGWIADLEYNATKRPWYTNAKNTPYQTVFTEPYIDDLDGQIIVTASQFIGKTNQKETVLAMDFYINLLGDILNIDNLPKNSYTFLADNLGNIIYHTDKTYAPTKDGMKAMKDISNYKNIVGIQNEIEIKDYDNIDRYFFQKSISSTGWTVYTAVPKSEIIYPSLKVLSAVIPAYLIIAILVIILTQIIVEKTIVKPINSIGTAMKKLSIGDLIIDLNIKRDDELGRLSEDIKQMVNVLHDMLGDLSIMSNKHQLGYSSYTIGEIKFSGVYKSVIVGINTMVKISNENFNELLNLIDKFDNGDFNAKIKNFPGEQAIGNEIVESLRNNLKNVNIEINHFVEATLSGQLSLRSDTEKFEGDWKEIMITLNKVMSGIYEPVHEVSNAILELSNGNLETEITKEYFGDFLLMKDSINLSTKTLKDYIQEISISLGKIANKDITYEIDREYIGDFSSIKDSIILINNNLKSIIGDIANTAIVVDDGVLNISNINEKVANGAITQSTLLHHLKTNLTDISEESTKNVKISNKVETLFESELENVRQSTKKMNEMLESMENINSSSKDISNVIKVIEDIAFQTNLLALNASIESARAGRHGVGFAVVATEVQMLANKSQQAAKKSNELIKDSLKAVTIGMQKANDTSNALIGIEKNIKKVSEFIILINTSSTKQNEDVLEAEKSVNEIDSIAQLNSAVAQENTSLSEELYKKTNDLAEMVNKFKLK